jgi:hypothetical protein
MLVLWNSTYGQVSVLGDWKSLCIGLTKEINKETKIQDRYDKVSVSFNADGSYRKIFFIPRDAKEVALYKNYEVKDKKLVKKQIVTVDGAALKMLIVKEKIETGKFEINPQGDTLILYDNSGGTTRLRFEKIESQLVLIDTVDERLVYITFTVDKSKRRKRGSS